MLQCNKIFIDSVNFCAQIPGSSASQCGLEFNGDEEMTKSSTNPMFNMDISKIMGDLKMPSLDFEQGMQTVRRNIEAMTAANQLAMEGWQTIARRQMEIIKNSLQESSTMINQLSAAGTPEEKVARQIELLKQSYEQACANVREVQELAAKSGDQAMEVISDRVCGSLDEIKSAARKTGKKAA